MKKILVHLYYMKQTYFAIYNKVSKPVSNIHYEFIQCYKMLPHFGIESVSA